MCGVGQAACCPVPGNESKRMEENMEDIRKDEFYMDLLKNRQGSLYYNRYWENKKIVIEVVSDVRKINQKQEELQTKIGTVYKDPYLVLLRDLVVFPDGSYGTHIRFIDGCEKGNSVVILPIATKGILLLRRFRHATRDFMWEIPRGFGNAQKEVEENAAMELLEKTGIEVTKAELVHLGSLHPDSGLFHKKVHVYAAVVGDVPGTCQGSKERIADMRVVSRQELLGEIASGRVNDMYTVSALMLALAKHVL